MITKTFTGGVHGIHGYIVSVEVYLSRGLRTFDIVGLADGAIRESKVRLKSAIENSNHHFPQSKIAINLAPADVQKEGTGYDLPMAVGIIAAQGIVNPSALSQLIFLGELSLDGSIRPVHGTLSIAIAAFNAGFKRLIVAKANACEARITEQLEVVGVSHLRDVMALLDGAETTDREIPQPGMERAKSSFSIDMSEVKGHENTKRAIEVAAAGGHNVLLIGSPGSGKTMLAQRIQTILPPLSFAESLETTMIYSVAGLMTAKHGLLADRPFRAPHHNLSASAMVGGGSYPKPGEVSLAHNGILFLDELSEFRRNILEFLRQPLEDKIVTISRAKTSITYPANFMLVCATNPCGCGYFGDPRKECRCTIHDLQKYQQRISGPFLDRIDIQYQVSSMNHHEIQDGRVGESSEKIRTRVIEARRFQLDRFRNDVIYCNAQMFPKHLKEHCKLDRACLALLGRAMEKMGLSARAYDRIRKVSRTIADLDGSGSIKPMHIREALLYRCLDKNLLQS